jgi:hypothetical protein
MKKQIRALTAATAAFVATVLLSTVVQADPKPGDLKKYEDTIALFKHAGESARYFHLAHAYAVFPTIGEGAFIVGGEGGKGGVFVGGHLVGEASLAGVSVGLQAGGKAFSEIIFFRDKRALDEFESGHFEFGADVAVTAITANAEAAATTQGGEAGMSGGEKDAKTVGHWYKGMAVFTIAKGGLMGQAAVAGQKFTYHPLSSS